MLWYHLIQPLYLFIVNNLFSFEVMIFALVVGIISFLFLECINYIEHYGLQRKKLASGRYERVEPHHSWNSNFNIGRITLYELTRHSDHHYKSSNITLGTLTSILEESHFMSLHDIVIITINLLRNIKF